MKPYQFYDKKAQNFFFFKRDIEDMQFYYHNFGNFLENETICQWKNETMIDKCDFDSTVKTIVSRIARNGAFSNFLEKLKGNENSQKYSKEEFIKVFNELDVISPYTIMFFKRLLKIHFKYNTFKKVNGRRCEDCESENLKENSCLCESCFKQSQEKYKHCDCEVIDIQEDYSRCNVCNKSFAEQLDEYISIFRKEIYIATIFTLIRYLSVEGNLELVLTIFDINEKT